MKNKSYSDKLKDPRWQKKRLEVFNRDNFTCKMCGDNETSLCIHHLKYSGNPWETENDFLITLCDKCHTVVEMSKNEFITIKDIDITKTKYDTQTVIIYRCVNKIGIVIWDNNDDIDTNLLISEKSLETIGKYKYIIDGL